MQRKGSRVVSEGDPRSVPLAVESLLRGEFVVAPTDTIYGILADALNYSAVRKLREVRRPSGRPFLVLIPDLSWVGKIGLSACNLERDLILAGGITVVLRKRGRLFHWLGVESTAVRIPKKGFIYRVIRRIGRPLVAPSANLEGKRPARSVGEAMEYFGEHVSLYVDGGKIEGGPSALVRLEGGNLEILRRGSFSGEAIERILKGLRPPRPFRG